MLTVQRERQSISRERSVSPTTIPDPERTTKPAKAQVNGQVNGHANGVENIKKHIHNHIPQPPKEAKQKQQQSQQKQQRRKPKAESLQPQILKRGSLSLAMNDQQQPIFPTNYITSVPSLDPRPIQELYHQRSYLDHDLSKQRNRSNTLFQKYAATEAAMLNPSTLKSSAQVKKAERYAASLKSKISQSTEQQLLILMKLDEIDLELQNRARWMMAHQKHHPAFINQQQWTMLASSHHQPALPPHLLPIMQQYPPLTAIHPPQPHPLAQHHTHHEHHDHGHDQHHHNQPPPLTPGPISPTNTSRPNKHHLVTKSALSPLAPIVTPSPGRKEPEDHSEGEIKFSQDIWTRHHRQPSQPQPSNSVSQTRYPLADTQLVLNSATDPTHTKSTPAHTKSTSSTPGATTIYVKDSRWDTQQEEEVEEKEEEEEDDDDDSELEELQAWNAKLRRTSAHVPLSLRAKEKRMSLPSLKSLWDSTCNSKSRRSSSVVGFGGGGNTCKEKEKECGD
ncbi:hypothetical protein QBC43DRAFT_369404 [Cladorrhinum sp. PSN259]|nr:hypothetical protein QBC43DRAFT_369404 [Cladorrhinum sp. PSN259]